MIYTIISNRESYADYCMGCLMASSDAEFQIYTTDSKLKAIHKTTDFLTNSMKNTNKNLNSDYASYIEANIYILVNGVGDGYIKTDWEGDEEKLEQLYLESREIHNEAYAKAKQEVYKLEQEALDKQKQMQATAQEAQRKREQAEYERLKAKLGES